MDDSGSLHRIDSDEHKKWLEEMNGALVEVKEAELEQVASFNREMRRKWYRENKNRPGNEAS